MLFGLTCFLGQEPALIISASSSISIVPCSSGSDLCLSDWQKAERERRGDPESERVVATLNDEDVTLDDDPLFGRRTVRTLTERLDLDSGALFLDVLLCFGLESA